MSEFVDTTQEQLLETLMLGLRLSQGINLEDLSQQFATEVIKKIVTLLIPFYQQGLVQFLDHHHNLIQPNFHQGLIRLTDPDGFLVSNEILSTLFAELSEL